MQCSAGKPCVLPFMWMPLDTHQSRPSTSPHGIGTPHWQLKPQHGNVLCDIAETTQERSMLHDMSSRLRSGLQIQGAHVTSLIHRGPTSQSARFRESSANVLVPDPKGFLRGPLSMPQQAWSIWWWSHMDQIFLVHPMNARSDWDLSNLETSMFNFSAHAWADFAVWPGTLSLKPLPSMNAVAMRGFAWSAAVFGWLIHVRLHPHEWLNARFPSSTLHCSNQWYSLLLSVVLAL